jgi:hypothetical protein
MTDDNELRKMLRDLFLRRGLDHHDHDIALLHDQAFGVADPDLGARPFAEQHPITDPEVDRDDPAGFVAPAGTDGDALALAGFSLAGSGMMMPPMVLSSASIRLTATRSCSGRGATCASAQRIFGRIAGHCPLFKLTHLIGRPRRSNETPCRKPVTGPRTTCQYICGREL